MSSNFNLEMLNLWIGLCRGAPGLPSEIHELGFRERFIEDTFYVSEADGLVHPELVIISENCGHTVVFEWKSGKNVDVDQLERYDAIEEEDLIENAHIPPSGTGSFDVTYIGKNDHRARLSVGLGKIDHECVFLVKDSAGLRREDGEFVLKALNELFDDTLRIEWERVPVEYVPVNEESAQWEVAEIVVPEIIQAMQRMAPTLGTEEIAIQVCDYTWRHMGSQARSKMRSTINAVLKHAAETKLSEYLDWMGGGVRITKNPVDHSGAQVTQQFQRLQRLSGELIEDLRAGAVVQEDLFDQR